MAKTKTQTAMETTMKQVRTYGEFCCRECKGDKYNHVGDLPETDFAGTLPDGSRFTSIYRERVSCKACGVISHLMQWKFDPAAWNE